MKKSRYREEQIIGILKQHEAGVKTADLQRFPVQAQFRHQQLQAAVLVFHRLEPLRFADLHAAATATSSHRTSPC